MSQVDRLALVVGINDYPDAPLTCATNDARDVAAALEMDEYHFKTSILLDRHATRSELLRQFAGVETSLPSMFLFYFAGHGCTTSLGTYLVTVDGEPFNEGLELDTLARVLENLSTKGITSIVILDCCHSGMAAPWSGARSMKYREIETSIPAVGKSRIVMGACRPDEYAYEDSSSGNGLFTGNLIAGLLGDAADQEGCVTVHGLYEHVARPFETTAKQTPVFRADVQGRVVLACGFAPRTTTPLDRDDNARLVDEARRFLDDYVASSSKATLSLDTWRTSGFRTACQNLEPILRWFARQLSQHPDLARNAEFTDLHASAQTRLAHLSNLDTGTRLDGRRRLTRRLGDGSFGNVWQVAFDNDAATPIAYKAYHAHELGVSEKIARFERGHRAMKKLDHPNIVKVGEYTNCPIGFFMDFIDGPNLRQLSQGLEDPADKVRLLITVAETLRHAHGRDVIHRDIKPENIVVEYDPDAAVWKPYLTDFDLAWFSTATQFTKEAVGTTFYAAPEQLANPSSRAAHSATVDIYAFGQLAYFLGTGSDPVPLGLADNGRALMHRLSDWASEKAARQFYELYRDCSETSAQERLRDFTGVLERLGDVLQSLREIGDTQELDTDRFLKEIAYALIGLRTAGTSSAGEFWSVSGQTNVMLRVTGVSDGRCRVVARLAPSGPLMLEGVTNERARAITNGRIDEAIRELQRVKRKSGSQGTYEVFLEFEPVSKNSTGIQACRAALVRAIGALERQ